MTTRFALFAATAVLAATSVALADPVVWDGPSITFTKPAFADWTLPQNQDRITDNVWITRKSTMGIFNIALESGYAAGSPADTEWAFDLHNPGEEITASNFQNLTFLPWVQSVNSAPPVMIGRPGVVHLISEDIYVNIMFTDWSAAGGGSFEYVRSTVPAPGAAWLVGAAGVMCARRRRRRER